MEDVQLKINNSGKGKFTIDANKEEIAEMVIGTSGDELTVYHTEVAPEWEGKGLAKKLMAAMVAFAGEHKMKVIPLCPYVHAQFQRHPQEYAAIWKKEEG